MDADPFFIGEGDIDAARVLVNQAKDAELFLYPGDQHYFADSSLPSYDADATALLVQRVLGFLRARVGDQSCRLPRTDQIVQSRRPGPAPACVAGPGRRPCSW